MTEPDPHVDMSTSNFRLRLMKEGLERAHLFRDGPSVFDLDTLGIQRPRKESDGPCKQTLMTPLDYTKILLPSQGRRTTMMNSMYQASKVEAVEVMAEVEERAVADMT